MTSFFGGDPNVSHFSIDVFYYTKAEGWDHANKKPFNKEARSNADKRRREQRLALKALGFKQRYFQYRKKDEAGKAKAKADAEAFAAKWKVKAGFELEVCEGFFL